MARIIELEFHVNEFGSVSVKELARRSEIRDEFECNGEFAGVKPQRCAQILRDWSRCLPRARRVKHGSTIWNDVSVDIVHVYLP